ncbi:MULTISPECIES: ABC transporter ATP-binding protein [Bacillaceae]|uniref:ABC transporter ATP-binding protein n=1 Tax=Evansella alkalicola TaxID=745819 RepID=A0ABS6JZE5_9BACI|nr:MULTISPECIES: ABC transporter ATP-binding protein [Bacillaceae]MBU9723843.1 ABC transporter ATP-binding protein [Bacillus alkalicola]
MTTTTSLIKVKNLRKQYKKFILGPIDFEVEMGTIVGLVGGNGSGKSTFLRLLMQIIKADEGQIDIFNQSLQENEVEIKQKIGYAGELLEPFGHLHVSELASLISYWYPRWDNERYKHLIQRYQIDPEETFAKASKGTKKKIDFVFALCHHPTLLLLDEPTSGVDIISQRKMREDIMTFMENGEKSVLLATHVVEEVNKLCDYVTVLDAGKVVESFNKDDVYEHWARMWVSYIPDSVKQQAYVVQYDVEPCQIVTNNMNALGALLEQEQVTITHTQRLTVEEVLEFLIEDQQ